MVDSRFFPSVSDRTLGALLQAVGRDDLAAELGVDGPVVEGANELEAANPGEIAVAASKQYAEALSNSSAGAVLIHKDLLEFVPQDCVAVIADDPRGVFTDLLDEIYGDVSAYHVSALGSIQAGSYDFGPDVRVGPGAIIADDVEIGAGSVIGPNCVIGAGVTIGRNCVLGANVTVLCTLMGDNVMVQPGARIGVEGFGWLDHGRSNRKVPQLGRVIVQDDVQIGANTVIDRGALGDTVIGEGTKIDNLVQIGHNSKLGRNCLIAATSGLSGSTIFGDSVLVGGGVGTAGHLSVGSGSIINGRAAVTKDWPEGSKLAGAPAQDVRDFWKELAVLRRLAKGDKK